MDNWTTDIWQNRQTNDKVMDKTKPRIVNGTKIDRTGSRFDRKENWQRKIGWKENWLRGKLTGSKNWRKGKIDWKEIDYKGKLTTRENWLKGKIDWKEKLTTRKID